MRHPAKPAAVFADTGQVLSFAALDSLADAAARWFIAAGLEPGDGVALLLENEPAFLVLTTYGAKRAGLMVTPLSIHLCAAEVAHVLRDSVAKLLVHAPKLDALAAGLPRGRRVPVCLMPCRRWRARMTRPCPSARSGGSSCIRQGQAGLPKGIRRPLLPFENRHAPEFDMTWKDFHGFGRDTACLSPAPPITRRPTAMCSGPSMAAHRCHHAQIRCRAARP